MSRCLSMGMISAILVALPGWAWSADMAEQLAADLNAAPCQLVLPLLHHVSCRTKGPMTVSPSAGGFRAEATEMVADIGKDHRIALGTIGIDLTPEPGGAWGFATVVPSPLVVTDGAGKPELEITVESQKLEGHWRPDIQALTGLDVTLHGLKLTPAAGGPPVTVGSLALAGALTETRPGHWGGPLTLTGEALVVPWAGGHGQVRLGSASLEGRVSGLDLTTLLSRRAQARPPGDAPATRVGLRSLARHYLAMVHDLVDGGALGLHLADLSITLPTSGTSVTIGRIAYRETLEGLEQGKPTLSASYEYGALAVAPPPSLQDFLPTAAKFSLTAQDLPGNALWQVIDRGLGADSHDGGALVKTALFEAEDALTRAGSLLTLEALNLDTPATTAALAGQMRYDAAAALGLVGHYDMTIRGFDAAMKAFQAPPGAEPLGEEARTILSMLTMVQVMGLPAKDAAGREARTYKVEVAPSGAVVLNGADISMLVQSLRDRLGRHDKPR